MNQQQTVTRTYRVAVKHGEDYTTIEDVVTLPVGASQEEIDQSVATGLAIFEAQRLAVEAQVAQIRQATPAATPEPGASDGQRKLIDTLAGEIGMTEDELIDVAERHGVESWEALTKRQASDMIDDLKALKTQQQAAPQTTARRDPPQQTQQQATPQATARRNPTPQPTRRDPPANQLAQARAAQAEAHERTGMPAPGDRIRNPGEPASDAQLRAIFRSVGKCSDRRLAALAGQVTQVLGRKADPRNLRDAEAVAALALTKGQASQIIGLLNEEAERASSRAA